MGKGQVLDNDSRVHGDDPAAVHALPRWHGSSWYPLPLRRPPQARAEITRASTISVSTAALLSVCFTGAQKQCISAYCASRSLLYCRASNMHQW
jgi:hypothetical protein